MMTLEQERARAMLYYGCKPSRTPLWRHFRYWLSELFEGWAHSVRPKSYNWDDDWTDLIQNIKPSDTPFNRKLNQQ